MFQVHKKCSLLTIHPSRRGRLCPLLKQWRVACVYGRLRSAASDSDALLVRGDTQGKVIT
uniref:Uncharacterized protein n=1 Tax=Brassica oleracea var. oleracea TaxID=109376 RepID=A0A0D3CB33_BRAOL